MEKKKDIKIFVSHRIDLDSETIDNPLFVPVRCGAVFDKRENITMLGDNTGDNISEKRMSFCELTVQYWAWKNVEADYYGLCHYRRYFSFSDKIWTETNIYNHIEEKILNKKFLDKYDVNYDKVSRLLDEYDVIKIFPMVLPSIEKTVYNSITKNVQVYDKKGIDLFIKILKEKYPDMSKYVDEYMNGRIWQAWNCYIFNKKLFNDYSTKLFDVLFELEKQLDSSDYNIEKKRMIGYMGECMFPVYCNYMIDKYNIRVKDVQLIEIKNPLKRNKPNPIFKDSINIVIASSNEYVPFLSVLLESIKCNSSSKRLYDIIILENKISMYNKEVIKKQFKENSNISIRFIDISRYLDEYKFYTRDHVTPMTYIRLAILDIFDLYNKVIYLDCDIVVNRDLAELYDIDISNYYLGAVRDTVMSGWINMDNYYKEYPSLLGIKNKFDYFNAGVLLVNVELLSKKYTSKFLFDVAVSKNWKWFDQDVLNKICVNKVKFLSQKWNVMSHLHTDMHDLPEYYSPAEIYEQYKEAIKTPYIIHYAGRCIPCFQPETDLAEIFWQYARQSPYYEKIIYKMEIETSSRVYYFSKNYRLKKVKQRIKNFIKIFLPKGTKRHRFVKKAYFKLRGWSFVE